MDKSTDTIDGHAIIVAAVQLIEHSKVIYQGVAIVRAESTCAAHVIVSGRRQVPVAGPNGLGMVPRCLSLAHTGIDDDDHVAVVVIVGVIGLKRNTVGCGQLAGLGYHRAQTHIIGVALVSSVILTVLG